MQLKPLHCLALRHGVGHQVYVHGAVLEADGVSLFNEGRVEAFIAGHREAEKGAHFFKAEHEVFDGVENVALIRVHQTNDQG